VMEDIKIAKEKYALHA
jgi:hypothetical protein